MTDLPGLLLARVPVAMASAIARNEAIRKRWKTVLITDLKTSPVEGIEEALFGVRGKDAFEITCGMAWKHHVTHAIVLTPYSVFGNNVREVLTMKGASFLWSEVFPSSKILLDRLGCQYTDPNEIDLYEGTAPVLEPQLPIGTRFSQPNRKTADEIVKLHGKDVIVVFGQVPCDHSMKNQAPRLGYYEWLDLIFRSNPDTRFLFKQHPASRSNPMCLTKGIDKYPNVAVINESIHSLFEAYDAFAAYGSTTILEGVSIGLPFATCGRHFVDHPSLVLKAQNDAGAGDLLAKLRAFKPDPAALERRLSFLTRHYSFSPDDPRIADRILLTSHEFFEGKA